MIMLKDFRTTLTLSSGGTMDLLLPKPEDIDFARDVAPVLGRLCRFGGHTSHLGHHYSVAEHCILVAEMVPPEDRLHALVHDAAEAYITDIPAPVRAATCGEAIERVESGIRRAILDSLGISHTLPQSVLEADAEIRHLEAKALFRPTPEWVDDEIAMACIRKVSKGHAEFQMMFSPAEASRMWFERVASYHAMLG